MNISSLPPKLREMAERNKTEKGATGLASAFVWSNSPEGHVFWSKIESGKIPKEYTQLLNIKTEKMQKTTAISLAKARAFPAKDLVNGQEFLTKQGKIHIVKQKNGTIYVCSNYIEVDGGKPRPMPAGYKYGYNLFSYSVVDLTCGERFSAFKSVEEVADVKMKFTESFNVRGTYGLLKAFKEEAIELGWEWVGTELGKGATMMGFWGDDGQFSGATNSGGYTYDLPAEWEDALSSAGEKEEVDDVEYVKCMTDDYTSDGITKGRIYKRDLSYECDYDYRIEEDDQGDEATWDKDDFEASTEEEYDAQGVNISSVGGYTINIKEVKINGYLPMKMVCIGCVDSQQVYSLGALQTLRDVMCSDDGTNEKEGVTFTLEQVEALIEACGGE